MAHNASNDLVVLRGARLGVTRGRRRRRLPLVEGEEVKMKRIRSGDRLTPPMQVLSRPAARGSLSPRRRSRQPPPLRRSDPRRSRGRARSLLREAHRATVCSGSGSRLWRCGEYSGKYRGCRSTPAHAPGCGGTLRFGAVPAGLWRPTVNRELGDPSERPLCGPHDEPRARRSPASAARARARDRGELHRRSLIRRRATGPSWRRDSAPACR